MGFPFNCYPPPVSVTSAALHPELLYLASFPYSVRYVECMLRSEVQGRGCDL